MSNQDNKKKELQYNEFGCLIREPYYLPNGCKFCGKRLKRVNKFHVDEGFCRKRHKDWFFNPKMIPKNKQQKIVAAQKRKKENSRSQWGFYGTDAWRALRKQALIKYGYACMKCGVTPKDKRNVHVDHIMPVRYFKALKLNFNNLQVLCSECNWEKGNKNYSDYRPVEHQVVVHHEQKFAPKLILRKKN